MKDKNKYVNLAREAIQILSPKYSEKESLESMLKKLRNTILLPASDTEWQIRTLSEKIAQEIETEGDISNIRELIKKLDFEVSFLPFD